MERKTIPFTVVPGTKVTDFARGPGPKRFDIAGTHGFCAALEGTWQLVVEGRGLVRASGDDGQVYGLAHPIDLAKEVEELLVGRRLVEARAHEVTGDLELELEGGVVLRVVADSSGFEVWSLRACDGAEWVGQGGGVIRAQPR